MRKNDIRKILDSIEGNPEILIYNGFVDDWMSIASIRETTLVKTKKETLKYIIEFQQGSEISDEYCDKRYKKEQWKLQKYETAPHEKTKTVYMIEAKNRDITTYDGCGTLSY
jgi:uncharacterized membrane protein YcaP (DUF421 family)